MHSVLHSINIRLLLPPRKKLLSTIADISSSLLYTSFSGYQSEVCTISLRQSEKCTGSRGYFTDLSTLRSLSAFLVGVDIKRAVFSSMIGWQEVRPALLLARYVTWHSLYWRLSCDHRHVTMFLTRGWRMRLSRFWQIYAYLTDSTCLAGKTSSHSAATSQLIPSIINCNTRQTFWNPATWDHFQILRGFRRIRMFAKFWQKHHRVSAKTVYWVNCQGNLAGEWWLRKLCWDSYEFPWTNYCWRNTVVFNSVNRWGFKIRILMPHVDYC